MPFLSYAQNFEDVLLWRALRDEADGFYVDVGAADPDEDSVTRAFYDRGWRGINVEPVADLAARLRDARPRDVTLAVAAGDRDGRITLHVVDGTGLSTTEDDAARAAAAGGFGSRALDVPLRTLRGILVEHAPPTIHFLKIDVEGAERAVLAGCDFDLFRPWIILVEATAPMTDVPVHASWEGILTRARYRHVWFDGLNRFYVAEERFDALAGHFRTPVNVFDDVRRAADLSPSERGRSAETAAIAARAAAAEASSRAAYARGFELARDLAQARREASDLGGLAAQRAGLVAERDAMVAERDARLAEMRDRAARLERELAEGAHALRELRRSTSWRISRPVRVLGGVARRLAGRGPGRREEAAIPVDAPAPVVAPPLPARPPAPAAPTPVPTPAPPPAAPPRPIPRGLDAVHQFHSGSAVGDAITNSMLMLRGVLRDLGYRSEIFVEHRDPCLREELRLLDELPAGDDHVLILRHSLGHGALGRVLATPAPKVLLYHNITPPEFLAGSPQLQEHARLGRRQLVDIRSRVVAALADSEYNAAELRALGYPLVRACALLFDLDRLARTAPPRLPGDGTFTVLFTGRVVESKAQAEIIEAYARFRAGMDRPCRLVLVGRTDGAEGYLDAIDAAMRRHGLEAEVVLTGLVSDEELRARFAEADLFLSLSRHEGFGVPLIEAIAHGVPVLAWPAGAIPYTLGGVGLLDIRDPAAVAARMLEVARDPGAREALVAAQRAAIGHFALPRQLPVLHQALALAGAVPPRDEAAREAMRPNLRFALSGHVAGSYSLASVNRALAFAVEAERPGGVRVEAVEGAPTGDLSGVPAAERERLAALAARGPAETGPLVTISQHYPVHLPETPGDLPLALLFWEETLLPAETVARLEAGFRAVLAPTAFVAKALQDSGLSLPVRVVGHAPDLSAMEALGRARDGAAAAPGRPLTFLHVSSLFPRKGADVLLTAFARAFRRGDPVRLVVKGFPNPHNTAAAELDALRRADPDLPAIELIDRDLPEAELVALYRDADAMVLPTRGEGLNLPAAEAMAAGLPLIVTGGGGHMDFVDADLARLVRWRFAPSRSHLAAPGSLWAEPDVDDLTAALRETAAALRDPAGRAALAERTRRARVRAAQRLRPAAFVRRLEDAALDLLLSPPLPRLRVAWVTSWEVRCGVAEYARQLLRAMPDDPAVASHVVLSDERWQPAGDAPDAASPRVRPCWRIGDPASLPGLAAAISAEDPHVVVLQHQPGLIGWRGLADLVASPALRDRTVVVTLHNTAHLVEEEPERASVAAALQGVDRLLVHAPGDLERLASIGLSRNVTLVPHGVKARPEPPPRAAAGGPIIGSYGFLLPGKGIGELIRAFSILRRDRPGARLRLVNADYGTEGSADEIRRCRRLADEEGVAELIEWHTGFLPEERSLALLGGCTVIVLPTQASRESSSASMRDAMVAGPPVLVTPVPIFDEAGDAVLRTDGVDPASLAAGIDRLLGSPSTLEQAGTAAREWLSGRAWPAVARRTQGLMIGLAAARHVSGGQRDRRPDHHADVSPGR